MRKLLIGIITLAMVTMCVACGEKPVETPKTEETPVGDEIEELQQEEPKQQGQTVDTQNGTSDDIGNYQKSFVLETKDFLNSYDQIPQVAELGQFKYMEKVRTIEDGVTVDSYGLTNNLSVHFYYQHEDTSHPIQVSLFTTDNATGSEIGALGGLTMNTVLLLENSKIEDIYNEIMETSIENDIMKRIDGDNCNITMVVQDNNIMNSFFAK